jgi:MFS family permease
MRLVLAVPLLGIAQIISWGSLFYSIGVLGSAMRAGTGVSELYLFGCFTVSLLLSGLLAPAIGRRIDARGGQSALATGSVVAGVALITLACAQGPVALALGWALAGVAMAATLYDPAFATLNQLSREHYRRTVTVLTLFGGFASTVFWPLTLVLVESMGWRGTLLIYAGMHLLICLPIHYFSLRQASVPAPQFSAGTLDAAAEVKQAADSPAVPARQAVLTFRWLALSFVAASFVVSIIGVHMISLLSGSGLSLGEAVLIGSLMGPMQVAGRLAEIGLLSRVRPAQVGLLALALLFAGVMILLLSEGSMSGMIFFVAAYGCGNGILTIVRGTAPAELIGRDQLGLLLGRLSRPAMIAKAVAPVAFTGLLALGITRGNALVLVALVAALAWTGFLYATRIAKQQGRNVTVT